jgi:serine/threonine-protein kinase HipA
MIQSESGWILSPAYDLLNVSIVNPEDKEEMALTITGKKRNLKRLDFETLAEGLGLNKKQTSSVFRRFEKHKKEALNWIDNSFLSDDMKVKYKTLILKRFERLYS